MPGEMVFILALHYLSKTFHVMVKIFFLSFLTIANVSNAFSQINSDNIISRWMSMENNLEVEVFKCGNQYKAKVFWFDDSDDKTKPMKGLIYNEENNEWEQEGKYIILTAART